ncbi:hypothetical protein LTR85_007571 [Meristemomyces frigidus]|nr:hypothetical protein LTR85_007571 [Meristemomyces frigidus]
MMRRQLGSWLKKTGDRVEKFQPKTLHLILPGCGGTYRFDETEGKHIGFTGCHDSVGVFFIIDDDHYFAANIDVRVRIDGSNANGIVTGSTMVPKTSGAFLEVSNGTTARLNEESAANTWNNLVLARSSRMRKSLVVVGSWMSSPALDDMVQDRVVKEVMAFLNVVEETGSMREPFRAVVVKLPSGDVSERADHWLEARRWSVVGMEDGERKWHFSVPP